jgi:hypothetical protein
MFITFLLLFAAFRATYFDCFLDIAEGVFLIHAFTQRMGIASPRTTDTGRVLWLNLMCFFDL